MILYSRLDKSERHKISTKLEANMIRDSRVSDNSLVCSHKALEVINSSQEELGSSEAEACESNTDNGKNGDSTTDAILYNDTHFGKGSRIIDNMNMNHQLQAMCSAWERLEGFEVVFSTIDHGYLLDSLYQHVHNWFPCIVLVKTVHQSNIPAAVIGCYLNSSMTPPSANRIKGDGHTFIFRLENGPTDSQCHRWVDLNSDNSENEKYDGTTRTQFATCSRNFISVGGSEREGTNGLRLDSNLCMVSSGPTDTFGNTTSLLNCQDTSTSLSNDDCADPSAPISVEAVEVWCNRLKAIHGGFTPSTKSLVK